VRGIEGCYRLDEHDEDDEGDEHHVDTERENTEVDEELDDKRQSQCRTQDRLPRWRPSAGGDGVRDRGARASASRTSSSAAAPALSARSAWPRYSATSRGVTGLLAKPGRRRIPERMYVYMLLKPRPRRRAPHDPRQDRRLQTTASKPTEHRFTTPRMALLLQHSSCSASTGEGGWRRWNPPSGGPLRPIS
jgi:hypothetical protein